MRSFMSNLRHPTAKRMEDYIGNLEKEKKKLLKTSDELQQRSEEILQESKELEAFETQLQEKFQQIQEQIEVIRHNLQQPNNTTVNEEPSNIIQQFQKFLVKPRSLCSLFRKYVSSNF